LFVETHSEAVVLLVPILVSTAKEFEEQMGIKEEWACSDRWLKCFNLWHANEKSDVSGQKKFADEDTTSETLNNWFKTVTQLLTDFIVWMKQDCV